MDSVDLIWKNGELVRWEDAQVHVLTHGLHYGTGVFEGIRCYETERGPAVFRNRDHLARLERSAELYYMPLPYTPEELRLGMHELIVRNELKSCYIRPLAFRGYGEMGLYAKGAPIDVIIAAWPWGAYLGEEGMRRGIRVKTSSYTRHHVNITMTQAKAVSNYTNSILANMEALDDGYDEAMLLDASGFVSEGAGENLFMVKKGVVYTPDLSAGALDGITRNTILAICSDLGLKLVEKRITRDEVYITNTVLCRPPGNRNPEADELAACAPFLADKLGVIQPKVILTLGSVATQAMLRTKEPIGKLRGRLHTYGASVLVPTFHPAFLLRNPGQEYKRMAWEDLKLAKREYDARRTR